MDIEEEPGPIVLEALRTLVDDFEKQGQEDMTVIGMSARLHRYKLEANDMQTTGNKGTDVFHRPNAPWLFTGLYTCLFRVIHDRHVLQLPDGMFEISWYIVVPGPSRVKYLWN